MIPKRGAIAVGLTAIALVLLINFKTPSDAVTAATDAAPVGGTSGSGSVAAGSSGSSGSSGTPGSGSSGSTGSTGSGAGTTDGSSSGSTSSDASGSSGSTDQSTRTVDGPTVDTRYGPVQVTVTLNGSTITDITADQLPGGDRRSEQISSRAEPALRSQALQAQSASIDGVSGATYTSEAYEQSLQAALDAAGA